MRLRDGAVDSTIATLARSVFRRRSTQAIANPANRFDHDGVSAKLAAQVRDMDRHNVRLSMKGASEHLLQDLGSRRGQPLTTQEQAKQTMFTRRKDDSFISHHRCRRVVLSINKAVTRELRESRCRSTTQERSKTCAQLFMLERLDQNAVGTTLERFDAGRDCVPRRQDQDWRVNAVAASIVDDCKTIVMQSEIEDDGIDVSLIEASKRLLSCCDDNFKAAVRTACERSRKRGVVVLGDEQHHLVGVALTTQTRDGFL